MEERPLHTIIENQRDYFRSGKTLDVAHRREALERLAHILRNNEGALLQALNEDLGKSAAEGYMTEVAMVHQEIKCALKNLNRWTRPVRVLPGISTQFSSGKIISEPYGVALIMAPWNYPINLSLSPLVAAIAAGNTAVLKLSRKSMATERLVRRLIVENFAPAYVTCLPADCNKDALLAENFDYIFFTGSAKVGKIVMRAAAEHLTPVTLELGGKSPCIIDETANLKLAARRIAWGKFLNAGQTCVSIDYILIDHRVKEAFVNTLVDELNRRYPNAVKSDLFPHIISRDHYDRLLRLMEGQTSIIGGACDADTLRIEPTLLPNASFDQLVMQEEIFGPLLPIIAYDQLDEVVSRLSQLPKPLACYIFTENAGVAKRLTRELHFGGGCINDVILHLSGDKMPFGGVGQSGMGSYHGKAGFDTFSHKKSVLNGVRLFDLPVRYAPLNEKKFKLLKKLI